MARVEKIITDMVEIFMEYAEKSGKKQQLSSDDFKALLETEIQSPKLKNEISAHDIDEAMKDMDKNHDGEINFREFSRCLTFLAKCYYNKRIGKGGKKGKGKECEEEEG